MEEGMILRRVTVAPFMENVYVVGDVESLECVVIDAGAEPQRILYEVSSRGLKGKLLVNTHGHLGHVGAVAAVQKATEAPFALHPADRKTLEHSKAQGPQMVPNWEDPPEPVVELIEGDEVQVGRFRFRVLETPGHTPGGICLYGHGVVFTGDTLFQGSIGRFDLPGGDGRSLLQGIQEKLMPLPDETVVYPGHGGESTIGQEWRSNPFLQPGGVPGLEL